MFELIRDLAKYWILRRTPTAELQRAKLESLAREFLPHVPGNEIDAKIHEAFRLGRSWINELERGISP